MNNELNLDDLAAHLSRGVGPCDRAAFLEIIVPKLLARCIAAEARLAEQEADNLADIIEQDHLDAVADGELEPTAADFDALDLHPPTYDDDLHDHGVPEW